MTTYTATLTTINEEMEDGTWDEITIYEDGTAIDQVWVESTEEPAPYDKAVQDALRKHAGKDADFTWETQSL